MKPRENVFQANGGSEKLIMSNENIKKMFIKAQSNFKSNKPLDSTRKWPKIQDKLIWGPIGNSCLCLGACCGPFPQGA